MFFFSLFSFSKDASGYKQLIHVKNKLKKDSERYAINLPYYHLELEKFFFNWDQLFNSHNSNFINSS